MRVLAKGPLRILSFVVLLGLAAWLGPGLTEAAAGDDMDDMEEPCAGDMQWMLGWCMGSVEPDVGALAVLAEPAPNDGNFTSINVPEALATQAFGINPRGDIVGAYTDRAVPPVIHGFVRRDGVFTTIDYPGATVNRTEAWGINSRGDIIGRYTRSDVPNHTFGFLLRRGVFTDISIGDHRHTLPTKVGQSGHIVGCFHETSGDVDMYGYVQRGPDIDTFPLPSTLGTSAMHNGVTPGGRTIVGLTFPVPDQSRGYILSDDTLTYVDFPGSNFTQAWDLNPHGTIVGVYRDAARRIHGFYRDERNGGADDQEGEFEDDAEEGVRYVSIDYPGSLQTRAFGINARSDIVGMYTDAAGTHGFLLTKSEREGDEDDDE